MGRLYQTPKEANKPQESEQTVQPGHSPLVEEADPSLPPDPEIIQAVAHIPQADAWADVEMQESHSPLGFEPDVSRSGYNVNLVRTDPTEPGSASPVMAGEDKMLDEECHSRAPGAGWPSNDENPDHTANN